MKSRMEPLKLTVALLAALVSPAAAQPVDDVAAKYVAATGGAVKWAELQSLQVSSRSDFFSFNMVWKKPGKVRIDAWSDVSSDTDSRAFDGGAGWRVNSMEGSTKPRSMAAQEIAELLEEADWMRDLVDYKAKGIKLKLLSTEPVDGQPAHRLEVVRPSGATVHVFVNAKSGLEVQRVKWATRPDGVAVELVMPVGEYRNVGGLLLPHRVGTATRTYEVNADVPDSRFQRPGPPSEREFASKKVANAAAALLPIGTIAPRWTLKDAKGAEHRSSDLAGRVVVLDFWATWCAPCHRMMPGLQKLHDEFSKDGVVVIGISTSERGGDPVQLMLDRGYSYQLLLNGEAVSKAFHVVGLPVVYVIGRDGRIVDATVGADEKVEESRRAIIAGLVGPR
jgi:peroxiredoxin